MSPLLPAMIWMYFLHLITSEPVCNAPLPGNQTLVYDWMEIFHLRPRAKQQVTCRPPVDCDASNPYAAGG